MHYMLFFEDLVASTIEIEDKTMYYDLHGDLIEHMWKLKAANTWTKNAYW